MFYGKCNYVTLCLSAVAVTFSPILAFKQILLKHFQLGHVQTIVEKQSNPSLSWQTTVCYFDKKVLSQGESHTIPHNNYILYFVHRMIFFLSLEHTSNLSVFQATSNQGINEKFQGVNRHGSLLILLGLVVFLARKPALS